MITITEFHIITFQQQIKKKCTKRSYNGGNSNSVGERQIQANPPGRQMPELEVLPRLLSLNI